MRTKLLAAIVRKELLDTRRDRRTLLMMVALPVLLYPATLLLATQAALVRQQQLEDTVARVAVVAADPSDEPVLRSWLAPSGDLELAEPDDPEQALERGDIDVIVVVRAPLLDTFDAGLTLPVDLLYDLTETKSAEAVDRVDDLLDTVYAEAQERRLENAVIPPGFIHPLETDRVSTASTEKQAGSLLGLLLPGLMIMVMALGAFYPAVDLTAGEKERGTFETLLSTPVSKLEIVTGKFLTVFLLAMITVALNLASMSASMWVLFYQISGMTGFELSFTLLNPWRVLLVLLAALVPLALLLSAVMMSVAVFARSFKEAQNYLTPVLLLVMLPAMLAAAPGVELSRATQFVPVVNSVLLIKGAMTGKIGLDAVFAVFVSTCAFAAMALSLAAWLFQREEVVLAEESGFPLSLRRGDYTPSPHPPLELALPLYGVVMLLIFYLGAYAQFRTPMPGLVFTEWVLILLPVLLSLWYARINIRESLRLRAAGPVQLLAAALTALAVLVLVMAFNTVHERILPVPESMREQFSAFLAPSGERPGLWLLFFAMAVSPAVCEEALFRGVILSALRRRLGPVATIVVVSVLFGVFHLSIYRFVPTALISLPITYVALRTGSIFPGMVMHGLNNAFALLLGTGLLPDMVTRLFLTPDGNTARQSPALVGSAVLALLCGIILLEWSSRGRRVPEP